MWKYVFAVVVVGLATVLRISAIDPVLEGQVPFPAYFAAVIAAVWVGGVGPGTLAAALGYLAAGAIFLQSRSAPPSGGYHLVSLVSYVVVCGSTLLLAERLSRAKARAEALAQEAREGQRALAEGDRRKDEFLATMAHELRNPLSPIRSGLDLVEREGTPPAMVRRAYRMMDRQVTHLVRLVDDLTDVSRISRGTLALRKRWVDLEEVMGDAVDTSRARIDAAGVHLDIDVPDEKVWVYADPTRLAQVLANLLDNAAIFTKEGGRIELRVAAERGPGGGNGGGDAGGDERVVLAVRDTGTGISAEVLPKVFDLFALARRDDGEKAKGLGIGLYLVRSLVELHGGTVEARSAGTGQGSEFVVRLPVARGADAPRPEAPPQSAQPPPPPRELQRLLVVDDNADVASGLAEVLKLLGYDVQIASDGPSALRLQASYQPDLVFLDIGLPGMDGYEVARRLRKQHDAKRPVLVAVTGWGQEEDRRRSREAGFDVHLVKPLDIPMLEQVLREGYQPSFDRSAPANVSPMR
jgi:signal transduction histidine kinase/CheY-like chemotaxis protein